jgi:protein-S-isoprenylcysteine O-methyltransferase Ste14
MAAPGELWARWRVRAGYPIAIGFLWLATPTPRSIALGAAIGVMGLLIRASAAGHLRKGEALATVGPYGWTRNPLYFGSTVIAAGLGVAGNSWAAGGLILLYFLMFYPAVMNREEGELRARYGHEFDDYAARIPLFWPRPPRARPRAEAAARFSWPLYKRNREYQAALGFVAGFALVILRMFVRR